jgi:hypothetical protein
MITRLYYEVFDDMLLFDTTCWTNNYNMICAPCEGINHRWNNVFFEYVFLCSETQFFRWYTLYELINKKSLCCVDYCC